MTSSDIQESIPQGKVQPPTNTLLYEVLIKVAPSFELKPLEEITKISIHSNGLEADVLAGAQFIQDGAALQTTANEEEYASLEQRLVRYVRDLRSGHSYASVRRNELDNKFFPVLVDYINLLDRKFNTDSGKVTRLRRAVIKAFREKVGDVAYHFIPSMFMGLYKSVEQQLREEAEIQKS